MGIRITVVYPSDADFKLDYYLKNHMPMVQEKFGPHGMKGWTVTKIVGTPGGDPAPYSIAAFLEFGSTSEFEAALGAEAPAVLGDIPNFSDKQPVIMIGDIVGSA